MDSELNKLQQAVTSGASAGLKLCGEAGKGMILVLTVARLGICSSRTANPPRTEPPRAYVDGAEIEQCGAGRGDGVSRLQREVGGQKQVSGPLANKGSQEPPEPARKDAARITPNNHLVRVS